MIFSLHPGFWLAVGTDLLIAGTVKIGRARQDAMQRVCARATAHDYERVNGVLTCWMCDHEKTSTPGAPGQPAGGDR